MFFGGGNTKPICKSVESTFLIVYELCYSSISFSLRGDGVELSQYPTDDTGTTVEFNQAYGQFKPSDHHFIPQSVPGAVLYENNGALPSESDYEAIDDHSYVVPHL